MVKLTEKFLKERSEKDDSYFTVYDTYTPNYFRANVAGKFYSKYETLDLSQADLNIVDGIKRAKDKLPRQKYDWTVTESHEYGWFKPLVHLDRKDKRFYYPQLMTPTTKHEIRLRNDKTMQQPKFTGIPFKM